MSGAMNWDRVKKGEKLNSSLPVYEQPRLKYDYTDPFSKYEQMIQEEVLLIAKSGDILAEEFLIEKYRNFVRMRAQKYFLIGASMEDLVQEGFIGVYKAIRDYESASYDQKGNPRENPDPDKTYMSFRNFVQLCTDRQFITAIKTATRQKHQPLNQAVSLNKEIFDEDSDRTVMDIASSSEYKRHANNPENIVISREISDDLRGKIQDNLSDLELNVLNMYLSEMSYQEMAIAIYGQSPETIAGKLHKKVKTIDNALMRVKRKIERGVGYGSYQDSKKPRPEYNYYGRTENPRQPEKTSFIEEDDLSSLPIVIVPMEEIKRIREENRGRALFSTPSSAMNDEQPQTRKVSRTRISHDYDTPDFSYLQKEQSDLDKPEEQSGEIKKPREDKIERDGVKKPASRPGRKSQYGDTKEAVLAYYQTNCSGWTAGELLRKQHSGLYKKMRYFELLDHMTKAPSGRRKQETKDEKPVVENISLEMALYEASEISAAQTSRSLVILPDSYVSAISPVALKIPAKQNIRGKRKKQIVFETPRSEINTLNRLARYFSIDPQRALDYVKIAVESPGSQSKIFERELFNDFMDSVNAPGNQQALFKPETVAEIIGIETTKIIYAMQQGKIGIVGLVHRSDPLENVVRIPANALYKYMIDELFSDDAKPAKVYEFPQPLEERKAV